jgi:hypothetical protein
MRVRVPARVAAMASLALTVPALVISLAGTAGATGGFTASTQPEQGVQIYRCDEASKTFKFNRPEAVLRTPDGKVIQHGAGPSWVGPDGSRITGTVVSRTPRTFGNVPTIPELVLTANNDSPPGSFFAGVKTIRRIQTIGGDGVEGRPCTPKPGVAIEVRAGYRAVYVFER